jgi:predicted pyridoxine 5'-phosphate oxidase superfamily flavin-nucleotide-binding protein
MTILPEKVRQAWDERQVPSIFATVGADGMPNAIYVTCISLFGDDRIVIADNFFHKTRANILAGSTGSVLFRSKQGTQYQVKGTLEYHTEGGLFEDMKRWNLPDKPGHAAAALRIEEVYSGAERLA